jgi:hypothetical protein
MIERDLLYEGTDVIHEDYILFDDPITTQRPPLLVPLLGVGFQFRRAWGSGLLVEHLPSLHRALDSSPAPQKNKRNLTQSWVTLYLCAWWKAGGSEGVIFLILWNLSHVFTL